MSKSLTRYTDCQWCNTKPADVVVELYGEIVGVDPINLSSDMYNIADSTSINKLFAENKAEECGLFFRVGDTTIEIDTEKVTVTKENEHKKSAYWKDERI